MSSSGALACCFALRLAAPRRLAAALAAAAPGEDTPASLYSLSHRRARAAIVEDIPPVQGGTRFTASNGARTAALCARWKRVVIQLFSAGETAEKIDRAGDKSCENREQILRSSFLCPSEGSRSGSYVGDVQGRARGDPRLSRAKERSWGLRPAPVVAEVGSTPTDRAKIRTASESATDFRRR
jgi:hypothetical protein